MAEGSEDDAPERSSSSATATKEKSAKGNIVTRKLGPLPVWGWVVIGAGALYLLKKRSAKSSTSGPTAIGPTSAITGGGIPAGGYTGGADNVGLASLIQQLQNRLSTQQPAYTNVTGESISGGGYGPPSGFGNPGEPPIVTPQGSFLGIANTDLLRNLENAGQSIFIQTSPGVFQAVSDPSKINLSNTNIYQQVAPPASQTAPVSGVNPFPMGG